MLVTFVNGKTACRLYHNKQRIGRMIGEIDGEKFVCTRREYAPLNFKGCPFNQPGWGEEIE